MLDILEPYTAEQFLYWRAADRLSVAHEASRASRPSLGPGFSYEWYIVQCRAAERDEARGNLGSRRRLKATWTESEAPYAG